MSLSLHETSELRLRITELVDLLAAHDKLVKTFLVPIAQAAIDDCEHARAVVQPSSPGPHPGMDSIEDAGLALAYKAEGEAMLGLYQSSRHDMQNLRQLLKNALDRHDYLTNPSGKDSVNKLQTRITKACWNDAKALVAKFKSRTGKRSIGKVRDSSEVFSTWADNDLEDEVGYIRSARNWASENP